MWFCVCWGAPFCIYPEYSARGHIIRQAIFAGPGLRGERTLDGKVSHSWVSSSSFIPRRGLETLSSLAVIVSLFYHRSPTLLWFLFPLLLILEAFCKPFRTPNPRRQAGETKWLSIGGFTCHFAQRKVKGNRPGRPGGKAWTSLDLSSLIPSQTRMDKKKSWNQAW